MDERIDMTISSRLTGPFPIRVLLTKERWFRLHFVSQALPFRLCCWSGQNWAELQETCDDVDYGSAFVFNQTK